MTELDMLRMNLLGGMNNYVNEYVHDNDRCYSWALALGSTDGEVTEELIEEVALDPEKWAKICSYFGTLVRIQNMLD